MKITIEAVFIVAAVAAAGALVLLPRKPAAAAAAPAAGPVGAGALWFPSYLTPNSASFL